MSSQDYIRDLGDGGRPAGRGIAELLRVYMPGTLMPHLRLLFYALLCGLLSGLGGLSLALLLHAIQHIAFTYSPGELIGSESFLQGVSAATAERRILILCICGLVAGLGWYSLARYGRPLRSVNAVAKGARLPLLETAVHALLQVVTVALGSPLGREVAPREVGALLAQRLLSGAALAPEQCRLLLSCGAGAGLAAVYDVPVAGTVFILEVMMKQARIAVIWPAAVASFTAAIVARLALGDAPQYLIPDHHVTLTLVVVSALLGPFFSGLGATFRRLTAAVTRDTPPSLRGIFYALAAFAFIGLLAAKVPALLGNGRGPAELAFSQEISLQAVACLVVMKLVAIGLALRVGAKGGLLTPGFAIGALIGLLAGGSLAVWFPAVEPGALALIGGTSFLAASMLMPITAVCLVMEFTNAPLDMVIPIAAATIMGELCRPWIRRGIAPLRIKFAVT